VTAWWENALVYEIYPRSFQDSDGDGVGDLEGIRSRLDYLRWLGVDAIWIAPIYRSPLADFGYDVSNHTAIAPELGTDADFDRLIAEAHSRGIRVLLDLVVSHTSIEHPWFRERPDYYVWADDGPPNNWVASFGGPAWSRDSGSGRWYLHSFFAEQPDLDWRNPAVREEMAAVVRHWLDRGVDGFRIDAVDRLIKDAALRDDPVGARPFPLPLHPECQHLDPIHSRDDPEIGLALAALREAAGEAPLIGEVYLPADRLGRYLADLDRLFAFDLLHAPWDAERIATVLARLVEAAPEAASLAWVTSNHDFSRVASRWGERAVPGAAMLLLTLPGTAFVYQGEELGMVDGPGAEPPLDRFRRDGCRHPMQWEAGPGGGFSAGPPWLPLTDPGRRNVTDQRSDPGSTLNLFRRLIAVRRELSGPLAELELSGSRLSYRRGRHRVVLNLGRDGAPAGVRADERVVVAAPSDTAASPERLAPGAGLLLRTND
jgi:alpha-glucosidase